MLKRTVAAALLLSFVALSTFVDSADARKGRKCPRGQEDVGGVCVPDPTPGNHIPLSLGLN